MKISNPFPLAAAMLGAVLPAIAADNDTLISRESAKSHWEFQAGYGIRQSFDIHLSAASRDLFGGAFSPTAADAALYAAIGPDNAEADRLYDDGFVNIGSVYNLTSYWGYNNASQIRQSSQAWDPVDDQSLYLSRSGPIGISGFNSSADSDKEMFPYVEARRWWDCDSNSFWKEKGFITSWSWIPTNTAMTENLAIQRTTVVDEFFLYGIIPPPAPYTGPPLPPGPILDNIPHDRQVINGAAGLSGTTQSDVDLDLHTFSFGGILRYDPSQHQTLMDRIGLCGLDLQAGASINFARLKMHSTTTVSDSFGTVLGSFADRASTTRLMPGLYVSVGATIDLGEKDDWMLFTQARHDYAGAIKTDAGLSSATVDLKGFSVTIGIGKSL